MSERDDVRLARIALGWLVEPGNRALWQRVADHGPVRVLDGLLVTGGGDLLCQAAGARVDAADPRRLAEEALARTHRLGARVVVPEDDEWPRQLDDLIRIGTDGKDPVERDVAPPLCLWVRGPWRLDEALDRSVAVVGSRAATSYGEYVARKIGYGLAEKDWTLVSGGAYGVDAHAHRGAMTAGGTTVVVLACGVDRPYPAGHANLFDRVVEDGLLISEWPLGAEPFKHRFLIRNRVIAALTRGTVVVEAAARSGALQTLRRARQLERPAMAVPGPVTSAMSVGCHEWLRQEGVRLVAGVPHIVEEVGRLGVDLAPVPRGPERAGDRLDPAERRLVEALLKRKALSAQALAVRAGVTLRDAMRLLPGLVVRGFAQRREHGYLLTAPDGGPGHEDEDPAGQVDAAGPAGDGASA